MDHGDTLAYDAESQQQQQQQQPASRADGAVHSADSQDDGVASEQVKATPEERRAAAVAALHEAIDICLFYEHQPDMVSAKLGEAEDRFNAVLVRHLVDAVLLYRTRLAASIPPAGRTEYEQRSIVLAHQWVEAFDDGRTTFHSHRNQVPLAVDAPCIDEMVEYARVPCAVLAPRYAQTYSGSSFVGPMFSGRAQAVEGRMWLNWWTACVDILTLSWDDLLRVTTPASPAPSPMDSSHGDGRSAIGQMDAGAQIDARFCKGALLLGRALLDMGSNRVGVAVCTSKSFRYHWGSDVFSVRRAVSGSTPPSRAWTHTEEALPEHDHAGQHWAKLCVNPRADTYILGLDKWYVCRAALLAFVHLLERVYNTHAIFDALGIAHVENASVARVVPETVFNPATL